MKIAEPTAPFHYGYDRVMANRLAGIMAECAAEDDVLDFDELINPPAHAMKSRPLFDFMMRPDLGIEFVKRVGNPKSLSILSDQRLRWLRVAVSMTLTTLPNGWKCPSESERDAVAWAMDLVSNPGSDAHAELVGACLLCGSSTISDVAGFLQMRTDHVEAYHDLFFNVLSRRSELAYINLIVYPGRGTYLPVGMHKDFPVRHLLALALRCDGLAALRQHLGWTNAADATANLRDASRSALLALVSELPGMINSMKGEPQISTKLLIEALRSARSAVGQEASDETSSNGDDDFSKFAEGLLANDVEDLQKRIRLKMEQPCASP